MFEPIKTFNQMTEIVNEEIRKNKNRPSDEQLMTDYTIDFEAYDKDIVLNDIKPGDRLLWILKGDGCGTFLANLSAGEQARDLGRFYVDLGGKSAKNYIIDVHNNGTSKIRLMNPDQAMGVINETIIDPNREPPRKWISDKLAEKLGAINGGDIIKSKILNSIPLCSEDSIVIRVDTNPSIGQSEVTALRNHLGPESHEMRPFRYHLNTTLDMPFHRRLADNSTQYFEIKASWNSNYGEIKEVSEKEFKAARKTAKDLKVAHNGKPGVEPLSP